MTKKIILICMFISITLNIALGIIILSGGGNSENDQQKQLPYLSKRIFTENPNDIAINFTYLRKTLNAYVGAQSGKVGVYFEYLPSGTSIGVNEKDEVKLSSLSKV